MKKYKLIKNYPGSPELGTEFEYWTDGISEQIYNKSTNPSFIPLKTVKNNPEFWEEVVEKDYEILSLCTKSDSHMLKKPFYDIPNLLEQGCKINSVKRLSDGEVFTIGDEAMSKYGNYGHITEFQLKYSKIYISTKSGDNRCCLKDLKRVKKPLFTTEDSVNIFEGDNPKVYMVHKINDYKIKECIKKDVKPGSFSNKVYYFATKEAAEKYVLMNKPCLSFNMIIKYIPKLSPRLQKKLKNEIKNII
jgi:hypothetical protein